MQLTTLGHLELRSGGQALLPRRRKELTLLAVLAQRAPAPISRSELAALLWEGRDVMKVPTSALFRDQGQWAVYVAADDRARRMLVQLGRQTGQEAEVTSGLSEGMMVIVHPGDQVSDGARIAGRVDR